MSFKDRKSSRTFSGAGGGATEDRETKSTGTPYLKNISAIDMEHYLEAVHLYALASHSIVAPWLRGKIPTVMLEHPLPSDKEDLLGRLAKYQNLTVGPKSLMHLKATEVRAMLIQGIIDKNEEIANRDLPEDAERIIISEKTALRSLFPTNAIKSREVERSNLITSAANLLGKMVYSWPTKDVQIKMLSCPALMEAFENTDVILFQEELRAFSLAGSGNPEANREAAEAHLVLLTMKQGKSLEYFKAFTEAVLHVKVCKSTFTEFKIVDLFFRHLDQISFPQWHIKFLTKAEDLYRFQALSFEEAKGHALEYHNDVIRVSENAKSIQSKDRIREEAHPNHPKPINTVRDLKNALAGNQGASGISSVSHTVLASILSSKRPHDEVSKDYKQKLASKTPVVKKEAKEVKFGGETKRPCFSFRDKGSCKFGTSCHFAHTK